MSRRRVLLRAALRAPAVLGLSRAVAAQGAGPVTIIVPTTPGTSQDVLARLLALFLQRRLEQTVIVDNRPGASGNIGTQQVARAAPDGRTLLVQASPLVVNPSLFPATMGYDPMERFTTIAKLSNSFLVLVVRPDLPVESVQGLVDLARARPGALEYASPGNGTAQHLVMTLFTRTAGIDLTHIPYSGTAPAVQDLIGRRIAVAMLPYSIALPLAQAGQVRVLGIAAEQRWEDLAQVPTLADAGFPVPSPELWYALFGPAGMRPDTVTLLNGAVNDWLAEAHTREALRVQAMRPAGGTPEEARNYVGAQFAFWRQVIRQGNVSVE